MNLLKSPYGIFMNFFPLFCSIFENKVLYLRMYKFIRKAKLYLNEMRKNSRFFHRNKKGTKTSFISTEIQRILNEIYATKIYCQGVVGIQTQKFSSVLVQTLFYFIFGILRIFFQQLILLWDSAHIKNVFLCHWKDDFSRKINFIGKSLGRACK